MVGRSSILWSFPIIRLRVALVLFDTGLDGWMDIDLFWKRTWHSISPMGPSCFGQDSSMMVRAVTP